MPSDAVVRPLRTIRRSAPQAPVLLALTCLHEAYPQQQHPPYPFHDSLSQPGGNAEVARALAAQQATFAGLVDAIVPVDITRPEEGYEPVGLWWREIQRDAPSHAACHLPVLHAAACPRCCADLKDLHERAAMPYIHSAATLAATAALAPIPWVDIPVVAAIQTRMVYAIARVYHQQGSVHRLLEMLTAAGIGFAARLGVRELLKVVPLRRHDRGRNPRRRHGLLVHVRDRSRLLLVSKQRARGARTDQGGNITSVPRPLEQGSRDLEIDAANTGLAMRRVFRASIIVLFLAPFVLVLLATGLVFLWENPWLLKWLWIPVPLCWAIAYGLLRFVKRRYGSLWQPRSDVLMHWTDRDRQAWQKVLDYADQASATAANRFFEAALYAETTQSLAHQLAAHYHPHAKDAIENLTIPEILTAAELAVSDVRRFVEQNIPGSHLMTIRWLAKAPQVTSFWSRVRPFYYAASVFWHPWNVLSRAAANETVVSPVMDELKQEGMAGLYRAFVLQLGKYLIELNSHRLKVRARTLA